MKAKKPLPLLLGSAVLLGGTSQDAAQKTPPYSAAESYPNTADCLHSLVADLLTAAKNDDQGNLWSKVSEMDVPHYGNGSRALMGKRRGRPWQTPNRPCEVLGGCPVSRAWLNFFYSASLS